MAPNVVLDRLKAQLLASGFQQENYALFQVINQLIDVVRVQITNFNTAIGGGGGGGGVGILGASYLTRDKEVALPNSRQELAGSGIQFNDSPGGRRVISTALPIPLDGEQGEEGFIGLQGLQISSGGVPSSSTVIVGGIPGIDGLDGQEGESLIPGPVGPQGPAGTSAGRIYYFDPLDASDIATYFTALENPSPNAETTIAVVLLGTGNTLLGAFATEPGVPNVTSIPAGAQFTHIHAKTGAAGEICRLRIEVYYCNADGSGETLIRSAYSQNFSGTAIQEVQWDIYDSNSYTITATQRLVYKLYGARVSGGSGSNNLTVYFDGLINQSYGSITISQGITGPIGATGLQGVMGFFGEDGLDGEIYPIANGQGLPNFTPGSVIFAGLGGILSQDNANFFWDDTNKRLGIGTATPQSSLHVSYDAVIGADYGGGIFVGNATTKEKGVEIGYTGGGQNVGWIQSIYVGVSYNYLSLNPNGGNVGIGTVTPNASLHGWAGATNYAPSLTAYQTCAFDFESASVELALGVNTSSPYAYWIQAKYGGGGWTLSLNPLGGNVGIGTLGPNAKLVVTGASITPGDSGIFHVTTGDGSNLTDKLIIGVHDGDYSWIQAVKPGTGLMNLALNPSGGNVGIGTITPTSRLSIVGLPTSAAGLAAGDIWVDTTGGLNILKIV